MKCYTQKVETRWVVVDGKGRFMTCPDSGNYRFTRHLTRAALHPNKGVARWFLEDLPLSAPAGLKIVKIQVKTQVTLTHDAA